MALLSLSAFAKTHGASKQAAAKWKGRGLLVYEGDQVDVEASDRKLKAAGAGRFRLRRASDAPRQPARQPVVASVDAPVVDPVDGDDVDLGALVGFAEQLLAGQFADLATAQTVKENALALKHLVAARLAARAVVNIELAERAIFEDRRSARDAWMNWPSRIGPLLAADLDIDAGKAVEALTVYVHQQLTELGEPDLDFGSEREA